jgi:excisionase family DNA binding protein
MPEEKHGRRTGTGSGSRDFTITEVAEYLRADASTIYRLVARSVLPGFKVRGAFRFKRSEIDRWRFAQKQKR